LRAAKTKARAKSEWTTAKSFVTGRPPPREPQMSTRAMAEKPDHVAQNDGVARLGGPCIPRQPVEHRDSQERAPPEPQEGDQRRGGVGGQGAPPERPRREDQPEPDDAHVDRGDAEQDAQVHPRRSEEHTSELQSREN